MNVLSAELELACTSYTKARAVHRSCSRALCAFSKFLFFSSVSYFFFCVGSSKRLASAGAMLYSGVSNRSRGWKSRKTSDQWPLDTSNRLARQPSLRKFDGAARCNTAWDNLKRVCGPPTEIERVSTFELSSFLFISYLQPAGLIWS